MPHLKVEHGPDQGTRFELPSDNVKVGRRSTSDIRITDPKVSREQFRIYKKGKAYIIKDLNSRNGTLLNGKKINETTIRHGDKINVGKSVLIFIDPIEMTDHDLVKDNKSPVVQSEEIVAPKPIPQDNEPMIKPLPVIEQEAPNIEPVAIPEPVQEPEPIVEPVPVEEEQVVEPEEMDDFDIQPTMPHEQVKKDPNIELPRVQTRDKIPFEEDIAKMAQDQVVQPEPIEIKPVVEPDPVVELEPVIPEIEDMSEPEPIISSEPSEEESKPKPSEDNKNIQPVVLEETKKKEVPDIKIPKSKNVVLPSGIEILSPPYFDDDEDYDLPPQKKPEASRSQEPPKSGVEIIAPPTFDDEEVKLPPVSKPKISKPDQKGNVPKDPPKKPKIDRYGSVSKPKAPTVPKPPEQPVAKPVDPPKIESIPVEPPKVEVPKVESMEPKIEISEPPQQKSKSLIPDISEIELPEGEDISKINLRGYQVIDLLGHERHGNVYKARQVSMDRVVALKILSNEFTKDKKFIDGFVQEARYSGRVNHPHILQIHDVGERDGVYFFTREYVDGPILKEYLDENAPIPTDKALEFILQLTRAVDTIHQNELVHGDLKPLNIRLTNDDQSKILNLGMSKSFQKQMEDNKVTDDLVGVGNYRAPEQLADNQLEPASDIYSLGAIFYHMLTGQMPFNESSSNSEILESMNMPLDPVQSFNPSCPTEYNLVVQKMMAKSPQQRFQTASELIEILTGLETNRFIKFPIPSSNQKIVADFTKSTSASPATDNIPEIKHQKAKKTTSNDSPEKKHFVKIIVVIAISMVILGMLVYLILS